MMSLCPKFYFQGCFLKGSFLLPIAQAFWQIALLKRGPQHLPDAQTLMLGSAALYVLSGWPIAVESPTALFLDTFLLIVWCFALLSFFDLTNRWRQTLTAMFGTGVFFNVFTVTVVLSIDLGLPLIVWSTTLVIVLLWAVAVHGHILAQALDKPFGVGIALAVVYFLLSGLAAQNTSVQPDPDITGVNSPAE